MSDKGIARKGGAQAVKDAYAGLDKGADKKDKGAMVVKSDWKDMNKAGTVDEAQMNPAAAIMRLAPDGRSLAINDQYHQIVVDADTGVIKIYDRESRNDTRQEPSAYIKDGVMYTRDPSSGKYLKTVLPEGENRIVLSNGTDIFLEKSSQGPGWDMHVTQTGAHRDVGTKKDAQGNSRNGLGGAHFIVRNIGSGVPFEVPDEEGGGSGNVIATLGDGQEFLNNRGEHNTSASEGASGASFEKYRQRLIEYYEQNPDELTQAIALQNQRGGDANGRAIGDISARDFVETFIQAPLLDGSTQEHEERQSTLNPIVLASMTHSKHPDAKHAWGERNTDNATFDEHIVHGHDGMRVDEVDSVNEDIYDEGATAGSITMRSGKSGDNANFRNAGAFLGQSFATGGELAEVEEFFSIGGPFPADGSEPVGADPAVDSSDDAEGDSDSADNGGGNGSRGGVSFRDWLNGNVTPAQWESAARSDDDEGSSDRPEKKKYSGPRW